LKQEYRLDVDKKAGLPSNFQEEEKWNETESEEECPEELEYL
jgi:hypothetical protein